MGVVVKSGSVYKVESSSRKGQFYEIDMTKPSCTCPAFRFQHSGSCKHIQAIQQNLATEHNDSYTAVLAFVRQHTRVDSVALIEQFGEAPVNELLQQGQLLEERGKIRILS